mmetsp:Transcript_42925/g.93230  ORF Transcript_42925/g.93230 Transcript_42925/m.93230 type:complete len:253 (-) Transcript_42925:13-771(-)
MLLLVHPTGVRRLKFTEIRRNSVVRNATEDSFLRLLISDIEQCKLSRLLEWHFLRPGRRDKKFDSIHHGVENVHARFSNCAARDATHDPAILRLGQIKEVVAHCNSVVPEVVDANTFSNLGLNMSWETIKQVQVAAPVYSSRNQGAEQLDQDSSMSSKAIQQSSCLSTSDVIAVEHFSDISCEKYLGHVFDSVHKISEIVVVDHDAIVDGVRRVQEVQVDRSTVGESEELGSNDDGLAIESDVQKYFLRNWI